MSIIKAQINRVPHARGPFQETTGTWYIEADETSARNPSFLLGVSKGRCFFLWEDDITKAKKFNSELQAYQWARDNRLLCGFRVTVRQTQTS